MARKFIFIGLALTLIAFIFSACTEELVEDYRVPLVREYQMVSHLKHEFDESKIDNVADFMTASSCIYVKEGTELVDSSKFEEYPVLQASIALKHSEYNITEDLLDCKVVSSDVRRCYLEDSSNSDCFAETDTLVATLNDGQVVTVPVNISTISKVLYGNRYFFGSDTLIDAKISAIKNLPLQKSSRSTYVSQSVNTEYSVELLLKEKNVSEPELHTLHLKAFAVRHIISEDEIASVTVENKFREIIDEFSERLGFDKVIVMKSGERISERKSLMLKRNFEAINPYDKYVKNFEYSLLKSNGLVSGKEDEVRLEDAWSVFGVSDKYSADFSNNIADDAIATDYSFYHERAVYKDNFVSVKFDYITPVVKEVDTKVSNKTSDKDGFEKALFHNAINAQYLDFPHNLFEDVYLYKTSRIIKGYDFRDASLEISNDEVKATLNYIIQFSDGSEEVDIQTKSFPRSLVCKSNWSANELNDKASTDEAKIELVSSNEQSDGYWHFATETRSISTIATLNASKQTNLWTAIDPNNISYTRNGRTFRFDKIEFSAHNAGSDVKLANEADNVQTYIYTNILGVKFGSDSISSEAHGSINVDTKLVLGHEIRDAKLVVSDNNVTTSLNFVTRFNDGSEKVEAISKNFERSLKCYTNWTKKSDNNNPLTKPAVLKLENSEKVLDASWTYAKETYDITTDVLFKTNSNDKEVNGWKAVLPNHIVYSREGVTHDFGDLILTAKETGATIVKSNDSGVESTYKYTDNISLSCSDNTISSSAFGTIFSQATVSDFEIRNPKLVVNNDNVSASLSFVTIYSNGFEKSENVTKSFGRSLICESNWKSVEDNNNQQTDDAVVALVNSEVINDGFWSYNVETRSITAKVNLNASVQNNKWKSIDPNEITYSREGKTFKFDVLDFAAVQSGASTSVSSDNEVETNFAYSDVINVTFGNNSQNSSAPGLITVQKPWNPDFPTEWGKFVKAVCTVSYNESKSDWLYAWSIHFEKGTLPVIVDKNVSSIKLNQSYFEYDTNDRFNGAVFKNNKWLNSIATDEKNYMLWSDTNLTALGALVYPTATCWGWNNGHNTVKTNAFTFSVENNGTLLRIYFNEKLVATYKSAR